MSDFRLKMVFGFSVLAVLAAVALIIALGKVSQDTSYGLEIVLGALAVLSGGFAQWAFGQSTESKKDNTVAQP